METRTTIGIKLSVEGIHNFPNASEIFGNEVRFLELPHRHNFGIECKASVNHDNRDKEFILLKREVLNYMAQKFGTKDNDLPIHIFGMMSCEMIAKDILSHFDFEYVKVDEDGENYAEVCKVCHQETIEESNNESKSTLKCVNFIVGKFCSGKSTLSKDLLQKYMYQNKGDCIQIIEVGDLVRKIVGQNNRVWNGDLEEILVKELIAIIDKSKSFENLTTIQIVGIRQLSILTKLLSFISEEKIDYKIYWTVCSKQERRRRFLQQSENENSKNFGLSFDLIEEREERLGINDLFEFITKEFLDSENCIISRSI